jgi:putative ATP-dependent endonuclease of OLD family
MRDTKLTKAPPAMGKLRGVAAGMGIFLNSTTFEVDLLDVCGDEMFTLLHELAPSRTAKKRAESWAAERPTAEKDQRRLVKDIEVIGKGRFAQRLSSRIQGAAPPSYVADALDYLRTKLDGRR